VIFFFVYVQRSVVFVECGVVGKSETWPPQNPSFFTMGVGGKGGAIVPLPRFTIVEVAKHNVPHDAWLVIHGKVRWKLRGLFVVTRTSLWHVNRKFSGRCTTCPAGRIILAAR
jgi:hypothetical protein